MLRIVHEGCSALRLQAEGGAVVFDPLSPSDLPAILTWHEAERLQGVLRAVREGRRPVVLAAPTILGWLAERGSLDAREAPACLDGLRIEAVPYRPHPYVDLPEALLKTGAALRRPLMATRRLATRVSLPQSLPQAWQLTWPDGTRVVHLNCALHRWTPPEWLDLQASRLAGADCLILGVDYGQQGAVAERILRFRPKRLILADLTGDVRRRIGMPVEPLTLLSDRLRAVGQDALVLASGASLRLGGPSLQ